MQRSLNEILYASFAFGMKRHLYMTDPLLAHSGRMTE
jgi:hypothetical protein